MNDIIIYKDSYLLTKNGYILVQDLDIYNDINNIKNTIEIWNGTTWIFAKVKRYNDYISKKIYKLLLSDGCEIYCPESFNLNIINSIKSNSLSDVNKTEVTNLKVNDLIYTFNFPIINNTLENKNILYPYTHGYYCGCMNKINGFKDDLRFEANLIYLNLINDKQKIQKKIDICGKYSLDKTKNILTGLLKIDMDKNITSPICGNIENKLLWLSGLIDNNGFITYLKDAKYLNISVLSKKFAMEIKFLFNTLGINPNICLKNIIRKFKLESGEIDEINNTHWVITLNAEETNKIFLESEFDLKLYYLNYDKKLYSIDQDINRYIYIKKIKETKLKKDSYIMENINLVTINSCVINGVLFYH
jgi:hypothetical protein